MTLRRAIFWIHLCDGVTAAIVILMMSVTGVILTYEMQLNEWFFAVKTAAADSRPTVAPAPVTVPLMANRWEPRQGILVPAQFTRSGIRRSSAGPRAPS